MLVKPLLNFTRDASAEAFSSQISGLLGLAGHICLPSPVSQYSSLACWGSGLQPAVPKSNPSSLTWCMILQAKSMSRRSCKPGCRVLQTFVHHCAERSLWELPADLLPFTVTWDKRCCLYSHRDLQLILPRNGAFFLFLIEWSVFWGNILFCAACFKVFHCVISTLFSHLVTPALCTPCSTIHGNIHVSYIYFSFTQLCDSSQTHLGNVALN